MNILVGTDIIAIERIRKAVQNPRFIEKVFTEKEKNYCEEKKVQKYQSYAGKFAAKEAVYKAINKKINSDYKWTDFEILNDEKGRPFINIKNKIEGLKNIELSISHCNTYAISYVIAIFN